jgi:hypothetical protein
MRLTSMYSYMTSGMAAMLPPISAGRRRPRRPALCCSYCIIGFRRGQERSGWRPGRIRPGKREEAGEKRGISLNLRKIVV